METGCILKINCEKCSKYENCIFASPISQKDINNISLTI